jgi:hypothetical protein
MDHGVPIATITHRKYGNQKLWNACEQREPAVYISRLIVRRAYAGNHIGTALIDLGRAPYATKLASPMDQS